MILVRLLRPYTLNTGKRIKPGKVFSRERKEALRMIENNIAIEYKGPFPPKPMKFNLKDLIQWQQQE